MIGSLLIKNALLVSNNESTDILISNNKITRISKNISNDMDVECIDLHNEYYVSPGWIDMHVHCYPKWDLYYDDALEIGVKSGVTTVVDAGSCGSLNIDSFFSENKDKITNIYTFLNISDEGIHRQNELSNMDNINEEHILAAINNNIGAIKGLKVRMSASVIGDNGIKPLVKALEIQRKTNLPLMVHCGSNPPTIEELLSLLGGKTILTHCFHGKANSILDDNRKVKKEFIAAVNRGMKLDLGHGRESFDWTVAYDCMQQGIYVDTISTDIYHDNRVNGPVYSLAVTMNKMLAIGYSLERIIDCVTINPATILGVDEFLGKLCVGYNADVTFFKIEDKIVEYYDSKKQKMKTDRQITPYAVVISGKFIKI